MRHGHWHFTFSIRYFDEVCSPEDPVVSGAAEQHAQLVPNLPFDWEVEASKSTVSGETER
jgi:hypothetical protein